MYVHRSLDQDKRSISYAPIFPQAVVLVGLDRPLAWLALPVFTVTRTTLSAFR